MNGKLIATKDMEINPFKQFEAEHLEEFFDKIREANDQGRVRNINLRSEDWETPDGTIAINGKTIFKRVEVTFTYIV